jgi:hypothetical protein
VLEFVRRFERTTVTPFKWRLPVLGESFGNCS